MVIGRSIKKYCALLNLECVVVAKRVDIAFTDTIKTCILYKGFQMNTFFVSGTGTYIPGHVLSYPETTLNLQQVNVYQSSLTIGTPDVQGMILRKRNES